MANEGQTETRVSATKDDPIYVVESEKAGKRAAHKPGSLKEQGD